MKFLVVTGLSGAGKSTVIKILEDIGYFCIDNMPAALIPKFTEMCASSYAGKERVAFVIDARSGSLVLEFTDELDKLKQKGHECEILFLEADAETITARYKETRRKHPSSETGRITDGIEYEKKLLQEIRKKADYIINTTNKKPASLRDEIVSLFGNTEGILPISITVLSFGFKHGIPIDSDLVFDVRFLPNPFYVSKLKEMVGTDKDVADFVFKYEQTNEFVKMLKDMLLYTMPYYMDEGKSQLVVSIGCTGGHHRSVAVAEAINKFLMDKGFRSKVYHRDIQK